MEEIMMFFVEVLYGICIVALAAYGANSLYLTYMYWQTPKKELNEYPVDAEWPMVTVQLPIYNERHTVVRLLETVLSMDYPIDKLDVQILDDSTDDTSEIVQETLRRLAPLDGVVHHLRRTNRVEFKAGALAAGLASARGEFICVFDADFCPPPEFLRQCIAQFTSPDIGCVQTRWGHVNRDYSYFTKIQSMGIDGHFVIEQSARNLNGFFINFNGTGGVWRKACIADGGGWSGDTLAEDLDLSYRCQFRGWRMSYHPDIICPAELPVHISAFKMQQYRWAKGSIQCAKKLLPHLWKSHQPLYVKIQGTLHLTGYSVSVLMMLIVVLTLPIGFSKNAYLMLISALLMFCSIGPPMMYASSQIALDHPERIMNLPLLVALGYGLALNNAQAVIEGYFTTGGEFKRTPKYGVKKKGDMSGNLLGRYGDLVKKLPIGEMGMLVFVSLLFAASYYWQANQGVYPWLITYFASYLYMVASGCSDVFEGMWKSKAAKSKDLVPAKDMMV